ncbi:rhodanese-like domain-containing protein [Fructilactobacillus vespulae]|uniref:rhodanese-like domain-containing protein n=1 Tax=Fructilactobacillus vespulae TaxID=1249630 RepID=UPI0039B4E450
MAGFLNFITIFLVAVIILFAIWMGVHYLNIFRTKKYAKFLSEDEFTKGMRKAQVIDLRESNPFKNGHILGARNIPYSTFKNFYADIRPDLPVYLYDQTTTISMKAAKFLNNKNFKNISILDKGYQNWDGKVKKG